MIAVLPLLIQTLLIEQKNSASHYDQGQRIPRGQMENSRLKTNTLLVTGGAS